MIVVFAIEELVGWSVAEVMAVVVAVFGGGGDGGRGCGCHCHHLHLEWRRCCCRRHY